MWSIFYMRVCTCTYIQYTCSVSKRTFNQGTEVMYAYLYACAWDACICVRAQCTWARASAEPYTHAHTYRAKLFAASCTMSNGRQPDIGDKSLFLLICIIWKIYVDVCYGRTCLLSIGASCTQLFVLWCPYFILLDQKCESEAMRRLELDERWNKTMPTIACSWTSHVKVHGVVHVQVEPQNRKECYCSNRNWRWTGPDNSHLCWNHRRITGGSSLAWHVEYEVGCRILPPQRPRCSVRQGSERWCPITET